MKPSNFIQGFRSRIVFVFACFIWLIPSTIWASDWYVNNEAGSDETGTGSLSSPFRTVTHAVNHSGVSSGDVIRVLVGLHYNTTNGEVFPIRLPDNVDLQGVAEPIIDGRILPTIEGGSPFEEGLDNPRNVAILAAGGSTISNIHFIAENSPESSTDGTSILCTASSTTIQNNTFSGHGRSNITTIEDAHPIIRENVFNRHVTWGITIYDQSTPTVENNDFYGKGGVDCTGETRPIIQENTFICDDLAVSLKGEANATIVDNTIEGHSTFGICFRMQSTAMVQDNVIQNCPVGIYIHNSNTLPPDLGGGGRSDGGNRFNNIDWDLQNYSRNPVSALYNTWTHSPCCEFIDAASIYDDEDDALGHGAVDFGFCIMCICAVSLEEFWGGLFDPPEPPVPGPIPSPYYGRWQYVPTYVPESQMKEMDDFIFIFDSTQREMKTFSKIKLGLTKEDGPVTSAFAVEGWKDKILYTAALPFMDLKEPNAGIILVFDENGNLTSRIEGKTENERLGLSMDVEKHEIVVASTQRVLRLAYGQIIQELNLEKELKTTTNIQVSFIQDRDGDKKPDIQILSLPVPKEKSGKDKSIKIIGSGTGTFLKQY